MAAEVFLGGVACALILAAVAIANAYPWPAGIVRRYAEANHIALPDGGLFIAHGIAIPVLIAIGVGVAVTFLATRTRFGRYVYAIGGNPEAAELAGVNTRWVIMKIFMLMGLLAAIAGAISIARLNAATNSEGTLTELLVIAAAVIGGTSLAGGVGTVAGAMLGARADAVAAVGHGAARRRYAAAEHRRRRRSRVRGRARHDLSAPRGMTTATNAVDPRPAKAGTQWICKGSKRSDSRYAG